MLKKENRLTKRTDFLLVKEMGTIQQSPFFGLSYFINEKSDNNKVGFIISKKISKKAVVRNKIRRQISEIIYKEINNLPKGFNGIFLVRQNILDADFEEIKSNILKIFNNVKKNST